MKARYLATVAATALLAVGAAHAQAPDAMKKDQPPAASSGTSTAPTAPAPSTTQQRPSAPSATTGQSPSTDIKGSAGTKADIKAGDSKVGVETKSGADVKSGTSAQSPQTKSGTTAQTPDTKAGAATTGQAASGPINLTAQQKTEIRQKVLVSALRVSSVNFALSVGTAVPRTVTLVAVPDTLITIHPQWRGYRYFVVRDEIVIVEPDTLKIVAVIIV